MLKTLEEFLKSPKNKAITLIVIAMTIGGMFIEDEPKSPPRNTEKKEVFSKESREKTDALMCAEQLVKKDFYPAKLKFGFISAFSARTAKWASGDWRVVNEFEANGFGRAYDCTVDISNDGCSGDCTYQ